ncbi:MAG: HAMP domain-containing sensor histidine kinase [Candidatus Sericytochromatia bacterium]|nr:HAMP domain-containing sensor histidine kinase [Candidatus Sericytochromatia bacterium]
MLALLAHELRTPLQLVTGLQDTLELALEAQEESHTVAGVLQSLREAQAQLSAVIGDVLTAAALATGQTSLQRERFCLAMMGRDVLTLLAPRAQAKGLQLTLRLPSELPLLQGDEPRLGDALSRLLGHVIDLAPPDSVVSLRGFLMPGRLGVSVDDRSECLLTHVQPPLPVCWHEVESLDVRKGPGLGLGLFIARRIIEAHGGRIGLRAVAGAGNSFWFTLPLPA